MIMTMHRLKRLIGSFYHQKRIDIIITDNAHYIQSDGTWKQKNVVIHDCKRTINGRERVYPIEFGHDAESNSDEHEDTGFHKQ